MNGEYDKILKKAERKRYILAFADYRFIGR
jgi:hypothetical protein